VQSCPRRRASLVDERPTRWTTRGSPEISFYETSFNGGKLESPLVIYNFFLVIFCLTIYFVKAKKLNILEYQQSRLKVSLSQTYRLEMTLVFILRKLAFLCHNINHRYTKLPGFTHEQARIDHVFGCWYLQCFGRLC
jgi:hypothetical protein